MKRAVRTDIDEAATVGTVLDRFAQRALSLFINDDISPTSSAWAGDIRKTAEREAEGAFS